MSKIGKKTISVPSGVQIQVKDGTILVKGPKGELQKNIPGLISITVDNDLVSVKPAEAVAGQKTKEIYSLWGLYRALVQGMIKGVTDGFEKILEFEGVGYKAAVKGDNLELSLGFSHLITVKAPQGVTFKVEKNVIKISGIDKELIGHVAAEIRSNREPEPYKGSGIRYKGEVIKKKAGKKAVATA